MRILYALTLLLLAVLVIAGAMLIRHPETKQNLSNQEAQFLGKAEIIRYAAAAGTELTEEYHLWLKIAVPKNEFSKIMAAGIKPNNKQQTETTTPDVLVIRGFGGEDLGNQSPNAQLALPLLFDKNIFFMPGFAIELPDEDFLVTPQISSAQIDFRSQFYFRNDESRQTVTLFIHLDSNIKPESLKRILSLSLTHLRNNKAVGSTTLPLFSF